MRGALIYKAVHAAGGTAMQHVQSWKDGIVEGWCSGSGSGGGRGSGCMPRAERVAYGQKCSVFGIRYSVEEKQMQIRGRFCVARYSASITVASSGCQPCLSTVPVGRKRNCTGGVLLPCSFNNVPALNSRLVGRIYIIWVPSGGILVHN